MDETEVSGSFGKKEQVLCSAHAHDGGEKLNFLFQLKNIFLLWLTHQQKNELPPFFFFTGKHVME